MFSVRQKREIADAVQKILRETNHPELPEGEIRFSLKVSGAESWSWATIKNNGSVENPSVNPWNEQQDSESAVDEEVVTEAVVPEEVVTEAVVPENIVTVTIS